MLESINITCPCCQGNFEFNFEAYVTSTEVDEDRGMGAETEYVVECPDYTCPECSKSISICGSIWEYPVGALNTTDLAITSA